MLLSVGTASAQTLACENTIYAIAGVSGNLYGLDLTTGAATLVNSEGVFSNALGVSRGGRAAYFYDNDPRTPLLRRYDPVSNSTTSFPGTTPVEGGTPQRGAVNPLTGIYYASSSTFTTPGVSVAYFYAFDTATDTFIGRVATLSLPETGSNFNSGDLAFSASGTGYLLVGAQLYRLSPLPTTAGDAVLSAEPMASVPAGSGNGLSFGSDGFMYISSQDVGVLSRHNPTTGAQVGSLVLNPGLWNSDLASCAAASVLSVQKNVAGRVNEGDQFTLSITGGGVAMGNTGTTTGTANGVQAQKAGEVLTVPGTTYTIAETAAGGANLANYASSWACVNANGGTPPTPAAGTGSTANITLPLNSNDEFVCTFTNSPGAADLSISKTSSSGAAVPAGGTVSYSIVATNNGPAAANGAVVRDPAAAGLSCTSNPTCVAAGGAACPAQLGVASLQGPGGLVIPSFPKGGTVTLGLTCNVTANGLP